MNTSDSIAKRLNPEISIKGLDQAFASLDANRATSYAQLGQVRSAKSSSLAREQKLLNIKYGTTDTTRAQYAAAVLPKNEQFRRELAATREVLEGTAPAVDENVFLVYGFVRRKNQAGIPGLTIALTDDQGIWIRRAGYACTDKRGYFELRVEKKRSDKTDDADAAAAAKTEEEQKREAEAAAAAAAAGKTVDTSPSGGIRTNLNSGQRIEANQTTDTRTGIQLRVFNRDGRVLHVEQRPVVPKLGTADYRLIILDDDDCGCTPPPEKSDGKPSPSAPATPAAPPPAPAQPAAPSSAEPRVGGMKSYENPAPVAASQPLEAIRGIGPKTATKLRSVGIADVAEFEKTQGQKLVKVAGFDKTPPKPAPTTKPAEKDVPKKPAPKKPVPAKKKRPQK